MEWNQASNAIPAFNRQFFESEATISRIGSGAIGGKAKGLLEASHLLAREFPEGGPGGCQVGIPQVVVVGTSVFDAFMSRNGLDPTELGELSDNRIAHLFQKCDLPTEILGDLRGLIDGVHSPLAVRSSSQLEDALYRPFAGVYATKMIPNNQPDTKSRFHRLVEAIKFVYATTYQADARAYRAAIREPDETEKMAVIIQEVVGTRFGDRYYPHISGVARSYNYYPSGRAKPEDGVVNLALGLGKTIVDGGVSWAYSPAFPKAPPPFGSARQILEETQTRFWAVNMGPPPAYDPVAETEYLSEAGLTEAEEDGTLGPLASTYEGASDRFSPGIGRPGPRALDFALPLQYGEPPVNEVAKGLLRICEESMGSAVEIEFAITLPTEPGQKMRVGFLQVRPMVGPEEKVEVSHDELSSPEMLVASHHVMGNGIVDTIQDVVYTRPEAFEARLTQAIATEIEALNRRLVGEGAPYLLMGFGRWGSSDPWLGIPVRWSQVSGARAIVEAGLETMAVEASQGSHFFHNLSSFRVSYFSVHLGRDPALDWEWLDAQPAQAETGLVRHVRLDRPVSIRVDGSTGLGVIQKPMAEPSGTPEGETEVQA